MRTITLLMFAVATMAANAQYQSGFNPIPIEFIQQNLSSRQANYDAQQKSECASIKEAWLSLHSYRTVTDGFKAKNQAVYMVNTTHTKRYNFDAYVKYGKITKIRSNAETWNFPTPVSISNQRALVSVDGNLFYLYFL